MIVDGLPTWLVTGYAEARAARADPRLSVNPEFAGPAPRAVPWVAATASAGLAQHLLRADPPDHTRLRRLVSQAFTARRVAALRPRIQQVADELIAAFQPRGRADQITELAQPLPMTIISELLGVPPADRAQFARWTNIYSGVDEGDAGRIPQALASIRGYLSALIEDKQRRLPADAEDGDLLDGLIAARDEGGRLDHARLVSMGWLLLAAGYETTGGLIGNGTLALLRHPGQLAALRADPALMGGHLAFSHGVHYCLGAPLARAEGQITLSALLAACPGLALAAEPDELTWRRSRFVRGLKHLPVTFTSS